MKFPTRTPRTYFLEIENRTEGETKVWWIEGKFTNKESVPEGTMLIGTSSVRNPVLFITSALMSDVIKGLIIKPLEERTK